MSVWLITSGRQHTPDEAGFHFISTNLRRQANELPAVVKQMN